MDKSESISSLAKALSQAQGEMKAAEMSSTNPFLKNKYADLGEVIKAAKPALAKFGLSYCQPVSGNGEWIGVTTLLMHESGEWVSEMVMLPLGDEKGKSSAQVAGSIVTYLRRYSLASMIGMHSDDDDDGSAPKKTTAPTETKAPESSQPAKPNGNGNGNGKKEERPYTPERVKSGLGALVAKMGPYSVTDKQRAMLRYCLDMAFQDDANVEDKRHTVLAYLTGESSTKTCSAAWVKVLLDKWLAPVQDNGGEYHIDAMAATEAQSIVTAALVVEGQQTLI